MQFRGYRFGLLPLVSAVSAVVFSASVCFAAPLRQYSPEELAMISRLVARVLAPNHYRAHKLDREMSQQLYREFLKMLDPGRIFFTTADLRPFEMRSGSLCEDLSKGDAGVAFVLYDLFRRRHREFRKFAAEYLAKPIDFTVDEY